MDLGGGKIEAGSSLTYIYAFEKQGLKVDQNEYEIEKGYDITPNNNNRPKLEISTDDRDLLYEEKDNTIRF